MLILGIILFGMIVGAGAQLVLGRSRTGVDWTMALAAGLLGSLLGGLVISLLAGDGLDLRPSGIIGSLGGRDRGDGWLAMVAGQAHPDKSERPCRPTVGRSPEVPPPLTRGGSPTLLRSPGWNDCPRSCSATAGGSSRSGSSCSWPDRRGGAVPNRLSYDFSLPGQQGYETEQKIIASYQGANAQAAYIPVLTVPSRPDGTRLGRRRPSGLRRAAKDPDPARRGLLADQGQGLHHQ